MSFIISLSAEEMIIDMSSRDTIMRWHCDHNCKCVSGINTWGNVTIFMKCLLNKASITSEGAVWPEECSGKFVRQLGLCEWLSPCICPVCTHPEGSNWDVTNPWTQQSPLRLSSENFSTSNVTLGADLFWWTTLVWLPCQKPEDLCELAVFRCAGVWVR